MADAVSEFNRWFWLAGITLVIAVALAEHQHPHWALAFGTFSLMFAERSGRLIGSRARPATPESTEPRS